MRPTKSVVDTPCVRWISLKKNLIKIVTYKLDNEKNVYLYTCIAWRP